MNKYRGQYPHRIRAIYQASTPDMGRHMRAETNNGNVYLLTPSEANNRMLPKMGSNVQDYNGTTLLYRGPYEMVGRRVEIPVHYDAWMQGARYGVVVGVQKAYGGISPALKVRLDHPQRKTLLRVWRIDWAHVRTLEDAASGVQAHG